MVGIYFPFGNNFFRSNETNLSMNALVTPCIAFKFSNSNMVDNMLIEAPS